MVILGVGRYRVSGNIGGKIGSVLILGVGIGAVIILRGRYMVSGNIGGLYRGSCIIGGRR